MRTLFGSKQDLEKYTLIWTYLNLSKPICTYMNLSDPIWIYLNLSEPIWTYLNLSKPINTYSNLLKPFWAYWNLSEPFRTYPNIYNLSKIILTCLNREIAGLYDPSVLLSNTHLKAELIHKVSKPFNFNKKYWFVWPFRTL